jgi:hypothetical protein
MRILLFLFFSGAFFTARSQALITQIKEVNPFNGSVYIFPNVTVRGNAKATQNINRYLQKELLDTEGKPPKRSIFENVWQSKERSTGTLSDIEYKIISNNAQFISLSISAEGCGAYCEFFTMHFAFDLQTGARVSAKQLFTAQGIKMIADSMHTQTVRLLDEQIRMAEDSLRKPSVQNNTEDKSHFTAVKELYQNCYWRDAVHDLIDIDFSVTKKEIVFFIGRCSNHADRAIDELYEMSFAFPIARLKNYLTAYGKKMLL